MDAETRVQLELARLLRGREPRPMTRVYVWDKVVRSCHWLIMISIIVLAITGIYIGDPFISAPGEAGEHFVMGWMRALHFYFAIVFTLAVLARLVWMAIGPDVARWPSFLPVTRERWAGMRDTFLFYILLKRKFPPMLGHNPLAGLTYYVVFLLLLLMILTGLAQYAMIEVDSIFRVFKVLLPLFGGAQTARWIHHVVMWLLIGFAVHHVYSAVMAAHIERNGILESIFTGYKWFRVKNNKLDSDEAEK
jgi:Ni/Fe-hydrogenase 1 B-type cytochrome subunit